MRGLAPLLIAVTGCQEPPRLIPSLPSVPSSAPADVPEKSSVAERTVDQLALERSEAARDRQLAALRVALARDAGPVSRERALYRMRLEAGWYEAATRWHLAHRHGRILLGDPDAPGIDDQVLFVESDLCSNSFSVGTFLRVHEPNQASFRELLCAEMNRARHIYPLLPRGRHLE